MVGDNSATTFYPARQKRQKRQKPQKCMVVKPLAFTYTHTGIRIHRLRQKKRAARLAALLAASKLADASIYVDDWAPWPSSCLWRNLLRDVAMLPQFKKSRIHVLCF